jgi:BASS family bile acid:Na+ symporter
MDGIRPAEIVGLVTLVMMFSAMCALGLDQSLQSVVALWRQPGLLARSLLAVLVLVPLVALLVTWLLPGLTSATHDAILFMVAATCAPFVARKAAGKAPTAAAYTVSLELTVAALALVTVPITVALLGLGRVSSLEVASQVFKVQLIPLGVGVLVRHWRPALAQRLVRPLSLLAIVLLAAITLVVAIFAGPRFLEHLNGPAILAIAVVVACSIAIGHLLGGPRPDTRIALALIAATRNLGLALVLAKAILPEPLPAQAIILTYTLVSQVLHIPYLMWRKRVAARQAPAAPAVPT